jgi:TonB family protein
VEASTIEKYSPEMPAMAKEQGLSGTAQVQVNLSASGQVLGAKIFASTGSSVLDSAAVEAAKRTTYTPKIVDCDRVPGSYLFRVDFESN